MLDTLLLLGQLQNSRKPETSFAAAFGYPFESSSVPVSILFCATSPDGNDIF